MSIEVICWTGWTLAAIDWAAFAVVARVLWKRLEKEEQETHYKDLERRIARRSEPCGL